MLFRRISIVAGLMALTLGTPSVLAQLSNSSSISNSTDSMMIAQFQGSESGVNDDFMAQDGPRGRIMEELNLSDAQKQEIQSIRESYRPQMQPLHEQLRSEQDELKNLMSSNASDSAIRSQHNEVISIRQELGTLRFESMLEVRNVLDESQRNQLREFMEENRGSRGPRRRGGNKNNS